MYQELNDNIIDIYRAFQTLMGSVPNDQLVKVPGTYTEVYSHLCWLNNADPKYFTMRSEEWVLSPHAYAIYKAKLAKRLCDK